ncbi:MAG: sn-glycerol-1-phosphate dehydrogenase [Acidobacteria bacterium]|nr:sn-glycerol-1-phosphate dehydrogenase [Acidobacteriota bacterium]
MAGLVSEQEEQLLAGALTAARTTRFVRVDRGVRRDTAAVFESLFGGRRAVVIADERTFEAAGRDVQDAFIRQAHDCDEPFVWEGRLSAEHSFVEQLQQALTGRDAIPVAVGSGTVNDISKLAAHRLGRPYISVTTAASMDGYTASGASITHQGSKQTFACPAPVAVVADLDVIADAPVGMNAWGYADLLAKCPAGADWILADAAGAEAIHQPAWNTVQGPLRSWLSSPGGVARNDPACIRHLVYGLMMSGFAMQASGSSRPASGAEHQFSHLWDMQGHAHNGVAPSHGSKVGIGTLASLALYEELLHLDPAAFTPGIAVERWPAWEELEGRIARTLGRGELGGKAREEMLAKYCTPEQLRDQLLRLRRAWPSLQCKLQRHLLSVSEARDMLCEAGAAFEPEQIGISRERLRLSYGQAYFIRRRFTVLDFAERWALTGRALRNLFGPGGTWPITEAGDSADAPPGERQ